MKISDIQKYPVLVQIFAAIVICMLPIIVPVMVAYNHREEIYEVFNSDLEQLFKIAFTGLIK